MTDLVSALAATNTASNVASNVASNIASNVASANEQTSSQKSRSKISADFDNFLKLLITQLTHQDPLSPLDTHQFTSQLVQFASVEQQIQQSSSLEKLVALMDSQQSPISDGIGYLGKRIVHSDSNLFLLSEDGDASLQFVLPAQARNAEIEIKDVDGKVVYSNQHIGLNIIDRGGSFRLGEDGGKSLTYRLQRGVSQGVAFITDSKGRIVHQKIVGGEGLLVWDGGNTQLGGRATEGEYNFNIRAYVDDGKAKRGEVVWHGFKDDKQRAESGRYTFSIRYDKLPEGTKAEPVEYISTSKVIGILADPEKGLRLQLDNGAEISPESALGVLS